MGKKTLKVDVPPEFADVKDDFIRLDGQWVALEYLLFLLSQGPLRVFVHPP